MARCALCGTTILFGGTRVGDDHYCNSACQAQAASIRVASLLPDDVIEEAVTSVHAGPCPRCGGSGPVDVHTSYRVWSAVFLTSWNDHPDVCCRWCATKNKLVSMAFCGVFGWWGIPWGLLATPIQLGRNFLGLFRGPNPDIPSRELWRPS